MLTNRLSNVKIFVLAMCASFLLISACESEETELDVGEVCETDDACKKGLICAEKICRQQCNSPNVCPTGQGCRGGVCRDCTESSQCAGNYACHVTDGVCLTACDTHDECKDSAFCSETRSCEADYNPGDNCYSHEQCPSGNCIDGMCCDDACTDKCFSCLSVHTGQSDGHCGPIQRGQDPFAQCTTPYTCDGQGSCFDSLIGDACSDGYECETGYCSEQICCSTSCDLSCYTCNQIDHLGQCLVDNSVCGDFPYVFQMDGNGTDLDIIPREEDYPIYHSYTSTRTDAEHRIDSDNPQIIITIAGATSATQVFADRQGGQSCHIEFNIDHIDQIEQPGGKKMLKIIASFANITGTAAAGMFALTVVTDVGTANAETFFLQGEPGDPQMVCDSGTCTLDSDLVVNQLKTKQAPDCPAGYEREFIETDYIVCKKGADEMVRVGNFWIDRYENIIVNDALYNNGTCNGPGEMYVSVDSLTDEGFPMNGNFTTDYYACSIAGVTPSYSVTWFQAQAACALAGKQLPTNAQWQIAAQGTDDRIDADAQGYCQINEVSSAAPVQTGSRYNCVSNWGVYDMVGSSMEWVALWMESGISSDLSNSMFYPWPDGYGNDFVINLWGRASNAPGSGSKNGMLSALIRGGNRFHGEGAGIFSIWSSTGPSYLNGRIGFRCVMY